jgi:hypothetical protein
LSGWPSETDSEVNRWLDIGFISFRSDREIKEVGHDTTPRLILQRQALTWLAGLSAGSAVWKAVQRPAAAMNRHLRNDN